MAAQPQRAPARTGNGCGAERSESGRAERGRAARLRRRYAQPSSTWLDLFEAVAPLLTRAEFADFVAVSLHGQPNQYITYMYILNGR